MGERSFSCVRYGVEGTEGEGPLEPERDGKRVGGRKEGKERGKREDIMHYVCTIPDHTCTYKCCDVTNWQVCPVLMLMVLQVISQHRT